MQDIDLTRTWEDLSKRHHLFGKHNYFVVTQQLTKKKIVANKKPWKFIHPRIVTSFAGMPLTRKYAIRISDVLIYGSYEW